MSRISHSYPRGAFVLTFVGAIFQALAALVESVGLLAAVRIRPYVFHEYMNGSLVYPSRMLPFVLPFALWLVLAWAFALLSLVSAFWMWRNPMGAGVLALLLSILALPTLWGFLLGSLLMFVGGILAIVWSPPASPAQPSQPQSSEPQPHPRASL